MFQFIIQYSRHCMLACLGPMAWRGLNGGKGRRERASVGLTGQRTVTSSADRGSSLIILPLVPASPYLSNKLKLAHTVSVCYEPTHPPILTLGLE
ncbi:hypothetical protein ElyMa_006709000 [Elysia marginata]|uniref:Uncharacterized protein n=1 Tax=Elysia marginata TaxID=1093978 RepID=A0AAV4IRT2_9GAST|nr:hypothetical protein ElyMa_006709000 [Elysia marginata]